MKRPLHISVLIVLGLSLLAAWCFYFAGHKPFAKFLLDSLTAVSVIIAIIVALFGDVLKGRVQLSIERPPIENSRTDDFEIKDKDVIKTIQVYCHHLIVRNEKPHLVVKNCRVWLIGMEDHVSGKWESEIQFAVPRLMEWAPNEYSEVCNHKMSFSDFQIFDFGKTFVETTGDFELHKYKKQGGKLDLNCKGGNRRRYIFRITVDNYAIRDQYVVEVRCNSFIPDDTWAYKWKTEVDPIGKTIPE